MCKTSLKTEHGGWPFFPSIPSSDVDDELGGKKRPCQCRVERNTTLFHQQLHKNRQQKARFLIFIAWVRIRVIIVRNQRPERSKTSVLCPSTLFLGRCIRSFLRLNELTSVLVARAGFSIQLSLGDGGTGFRGVGAFADQGTVWGSQGLGHSCFFTLLVNAMQQAACSAFGRGRRGAEPRTRGDLLPLALLLFLTG